MNQTSLRKKNTLQQCALSAFIKNGIRKDKAGKKNPSFPFETDACKEEVTNPAVHDHVARREKLERVISSILFSKKKVEGPEDSCRIERKSPPTTPGLPNKDESDKMKKGANLHCCIGASLHDALLQSVECSYVASQLHQKLQGECAREMCNLHSEWGESFEQLGYVLEGMDRFYNEALQYLYLQFALATHPQALRVGKSLTVDQIMEMSSSDEVEALLRSHLNVCTILKIRQQQLAKSEVQNE